jgi:hypothetical protein
MTDVAAGPDPASPDEPGAGPSCAGEPWADPSRSGERWPDPTAPGPSSPRHARPVRWLAGALTLGVLALLAMALTGAVAPQVRPTVSQDASWAGAGRVEVEVRNEALAGTRLVEAGEDVPGLDLVGVEVTRPDGFRSALGPDGADGVVIPGGGRATVVLTYEVTDCEFAAQASSRPVPVSFRTPLGLTRTLQVRHEGVWADSMAESSCPGGPGGPVA